MSLQIIELFFFQGRKRWKDNELLIFLSYVTFLDLEKFFFQVRPKKDGDPDPHRTPGPSKLCQILLALLAVGIVKPKVCETHPRNLYVWLVSRFSRWDSSLDVSRYSETPQPTFPPPAPASADDRLLSLPSPRSCCHHGPRL